jgi:hypothetical protein
MSKARSAQRIGRNRDHAAIGLRQFSQRDQIALGIDLVRLEGGPLLVGIHPYDRFTLFTLMSEDRLGSAKPSEQSLFIYVVPPRGS